MDRVNQPNFCYYFLICFRDPKVKDVDLFTKNERRVVMFLGTV